MSLSNEHFLSSKTVMKKWMIIFSVLPLLAHAIEVKEPENENETPPAVGALEAPEKIEDTTNDENIQPTGSSVDAKQIEDALSIIPTDFSFPENHKNFSQHLGSIEAPPAEYNQYQQQYQEYYNQKNQYTSYAKPIKFDGDGKINNGLGSYADNLIQYNKPLPYLYEQNTGASQVDALFSNDEQESSVLSEHKVKSHHSPEVFHQHHRDVTTPPKESPWKKIIKVLSAVLPFGLLLATLTPNILYVNSTEEVRPGRLRSLDNNDPLTQLVNKFGGMDVLDNPKCEDRLFCEMSRLGRSDNSNFIEKGFWYLANETPDDVALEVGMKELFKAIRTDNCSLYQCEPEKSQKTVQHDKSFRKTKKVTNV